MSASKKRIAQKSVLVMAVLLTACRSGQRSRSDSYLTVEQVKASSNEEGRGPTRLRGVVTVVNANFGFFVIQDETGGIKIQSSRVVENSLAGHRVEIEGSNTDAGAGAISGSAVRDLGPVVLPEPVSITAKELQLNTFDSKRVMLAGTARIGHVDAAGQLVIPMDVGGFEVSVRFMDDRGLDVEQLVDAEILVTGVASTSVDIDGRLTDLTILAPDPNAVRMQRKARDPASLAVQTVAEITKASGKVQEHRVRCRGLIEKGDETGGFRFRDSSGSIAISNVAGLDTGRASPVDVVAFVLHDNAGWQLTGVRPIFRTNPLAEKVSPRGPIKTVAELHALKAEEAALERAVLLEGVVTYFDPNWQMMFFQDRTGGVYISLHGSGSVPALWVGDRVVIRGFSGAGDFAPVVLRPQFHFIEHAILPAPSPLEAETIFSGAADSQWVELQGIVQGIGFDGNHPAAKLSWGVHTYKVIFPPSVKLTPEWIDARVNVRGAAGTLFNGGRQVLGIQLFVEGLDQMKRAPNSTRGDGGLPPVMPINNLLQFDPNEMPGHRVHLRGKVLASHAEGPTWIKDDSGAVAVREHNEVVLRGGDVVDVFGFAFPGAFAAEIHDAQVTKRARGGPVQPIDVTPERALFQGVHGQLVRLEGRLMSEYRSGQEQALLLRSGKTTFTVRGMGNLPVYDNGAVLRFTGICSVSAKRYRGVLVPSSFEIAVDSPASVTILRNAPWLTEQRAWRVLAFTSFLIAAVLVWVLMLRRRVSGQTRLIQQKLLEVEKLKQKAEAANEAKSQFLANMSHEIRTPMNGILGMTELAMQAESAEEQREYLSTLRSSGDALLAILNDLLDLSKIEAGKFEIERAPFSIRNLILDASKVFAYRMREKGLQFESSVADSLPDTLLGDALRLRQVLLNLLGNAVKFTHVGTVSLLATGERDGDQVHLRLVVRDSGIGIPREKQGRIFEAFRQADNLTARKYGGTGLGLSICVKLVALMEGKIEVESELGQGSAFAIDLLLRVAPESAVAASGATGGKLPAVMTPLNILLAEDNLVNQIVAAKLLKKQGHLVTVAGNGKLAVQEFERGAFDLILMDVQMPEMDGLEAAREIRLLERGRKTRVPIIALTAQTMEGDRENCLRAGMDGFASKPIRLPELWAAIGAAAAPATQ